MDKTEEIQHLAEEILKKDPTVLVAGGSLIAASRTSLLSEEDFKKVFQKFQSKKLVEPEAGAGHLTDAQVTGAVHDGVGRGRDREHERHAAAERAADRRRRRRNAGGLRRGDRERRQHRRGRRVRRDLGEEDPGDGEGDRQRHD